jgi:hypothetical protein
MAVWFILVICSFFYIWLVTGAYDTITGTVLALMGIGAGTALGAAVIDNGARNAAPAKLASKHSERGKIEVEVARLKKIGEIPSDLLADRFQTVTTDIENIEASLAPRESSGWLYDILSDANGSYSFHRYQIFIWTLVLVCLFLFSVWDVLSMPEFGGTLLVLLGISGGTYLGFKIPESQAQGKK